MNSIIVCTSVSHGNTQRVADVIGEVLTAPVVDPSQADVGELAAAELVGFGSGIFMGSFHHNLRTFVDQLPMTETGKAFVFATSGFRPRGLQPYFRPMTAAIEQKGWRVVDTFSSRGFDTFLPFKLVGGLRKGRPNDADLEAAQRFADGLRPHSGTTQ